MEKLLIFTNSLSIGNVDDEIEKKIVGIENISMEIPIQKFENGKLYPVCALQEGEIFFIIDSMTQKEYDEFLTTREHDHLLYILYHIKGGEFNIDFTANKKFVFPEIGQHIKDKGSKYREVTQILTDIQKDKKKRIIDLIFIRHYKLNVALEFLHSCLVESTVPKNTENLNGFLELETKCTKGKANGLTVNSLITNLKKDYKEDNLISLRDGILEMAGVK